jgi:exopolysaccharide biosynthesis polyprenyl glycosylphosphotransferase
MRIRRPRNLAIADALAIGLCLAGADWLGAARQCGSSTPFTGRWALREGVIIAAWLAVLYLAGAYDSQYLRMRGRSLYLAAVATALAGAVCAALFYAVPDWRMNRAAFALLCCTAGVLLGANRMLWLRRHRSAGAGEVFAVGDPALLWTVWREMNGRSGAALRLSLVSGTNGARRAGCLPLPGLPGVRICTPGEARDALSTNGARHTFISDGIIDGEEAADLLTEATVRGALVVDVFSFYELSTRRCPVFRVDGRWLFNARTQVPSPASLACKRALDWALALVAAPVVLPVVLLGAMATALESGFPVLYRQRRMGHRGECFTLLKLRTMPRNAEATTGAVWSGCDDPRATPIGRFLRRTGIDELPQLLNVVLGQMSLVGPRPERPEIVGRLRREIPLYMQRHVVPPGITGWAQIHQGGDTCVQDVVEKLRYDLYYAKHFSLRFDLSILLRTFQMVLARAKPTAKERPRVADLLSEERAEGARP